MIEKVNVESWPKVYDHPDFLNYFFYLTEKRSHKVEIIVSHQLKIYFQIIQNIALSVF